MNTKRGFSSAQTKDNRLNRFMNEASPVMHVLPKANLHKNKYENSSVLPVDEVAAGVSATGIIVPPLPTKNTHLILKT